MARYETAELDFAAELKFTDETQGQIEGYASMFGLVDQGGETVMPGAFKDTIARNKKSGLPMLWSHDSRQPIGLWTSMAEDEKGLKVNGELVLGVQKADEAYKLMKRGALKGLSIGFRTINAGVDKTTGARQLKTIDLFEISPVTMPMQREAGITRVKGEYAFDSEFDERKIERALRDEGLSSKDAKISIALFKKWAIRDGSQPGADLRDASADVLMALRKATEAMRA